MISGNTSVYKLKSSKSYNKEPEADYTNSDEDGYARDGGYRNSGSSRSRTRSTEYRSSRSAASGRSTLRGRRGETTTPRKGDHGDGYYNSRKYENNRNESSGGGYRGKFYEPDGKKLDAKLNLPEDTRISKLLRRLNIETNQEASLQISRKLLEVLMLPDNAAYVRKAFHILGESMYEILHVSPGLSAKQQAARALGRMGYIMGQEGDFDRYQNWLFSKLGTSYEEMQTLLVSALHETLAIERKKPILEEHVEILINNLVSLLEVTENVDVFKVILDVLVETVELYPDEFDGQFRDTIDLLFGWHVDYTQPLQVVEYISKKMLKLAQHFKCNVEFSLGLIENFLEDLDTYNNELEHVTVLILAMNTVLKCLDDSKLNAELVLSCLDSVIKAVDEKLDQVPANLIIAGNACLAQLLGCLDAKPCGVSLSVYNLIGKELKLCDDLPDCASVSVLLLVARVVKELSTNLPSDLIKTLIGPRSVLVRLRCTEYGDIKDAVVCVYQSLVNLKNVSLLQEVYRYLLNDLERYYVDLVPGYEGCLEEKAFGGSDEGCLDEKRLGGDSELAVLFLLRCLSQLANGSSIIVMWALKPSILDLVGVKLRPHDATLAKKYPHVQYCLLRLLFAHCKNYNHFITNSNLVSKSDFNRFALTTEDALSCNGGNFGIILEVLQRCLGCCSGEVALMLLRWLQDILLHSDTYLEAFYANPKFTLVAEILIKTGYSFDARIALAVCDNLDKLLANKQLAWSHGFLTRVSDLCKLHMTALDVAAQERYAQLATLIPWDVSVVELNRAADEQPSEEFNHYTVKMAQSLHLNGTFDCDLCAHQFKKFMGFLLDASPCDLTDIFTTSWVQDCDSQLDTELFYDLALNSSEVLTKWCTLEAAQYCVNHKLRTPLGKPNETFTKIEAALNRLGNTKFGEKTRVKMLLQFVEHLEKCIYNASEGCAVAMRQPSKGVRQFFIANANTCNEWLLRLRVVIVHVAVHCGETAAALKHGHSLLCDLKTTSGDFDRVMVFLTTALISLEEPEALTGLFVWAKGRGKKLTWIKCAADQASRKFEAAVEGYKKCCAESAEAERFVRSQIAACYKELDDWASLAAMGEVECDFKVTHPDSARYLASLQCELDGECSRKSHSFDNNESLEYLGSWELKEETSSWSVYENLTNIESNLYNYLASDRFRSALPQTLVTIRANLRCLLPLAPSEFLQSYALLQYVAMGLAENQPAQEVFLVSEGFDTSKIDTRILSRILWWSERFSEGATVFSSNLRLDIIKRARKETNFASASHQLHKFFQDKNIDFVCLQLLDLDEFKEKLTSDLSLCTTDICRAMVELIKLTYQRADQKTLALNLCALVSTTVSKYAELYASPDHKSISSKLLLKLASWMQLSDINCTELHSPLGKLLMVLPELDSTTFHAIPLQEMAVGKLLQFSAHQCQTLAKSWNAFGAWCYKWGRKTVDHTQDVVHSKEYDVFFAEELPLDCDAARIRAVLAPSGHEDADAFAATATIETQLRRLLPDQILIDKLMSIWKTTQTKLYYYYSLSAEAYFKYLHLSDTNCNTITITLRLLRLTVKYPLELQSILETNLKATPTKPWKSIIPQLFSRLNHPESFVRHCVSDLLCRVASDAPHLITFPAVVGALEGGLKFDFSEIRLPKDCLSQTNNNELDNDDEEEEEEEEEEEFESEEEGEASTTLQKCFGTMVETLSKRDAETIAQVRTLVKELRRVALLWDELWLGTLAQHQAEMGKRQRQLEYEIEKVNENPNLSASEKSRLVSEKHRIIVKPIVFVLEQLRDVTGVEPETPHERQFQEKYLADVDRVVAKLKNPDFPEKPHESLAPLKQLQKKFQQKFHKRASYSLRMRDVSPVLHSIKDTLIAMPGVANDADVKISRVGDVVSILPTKTKPKKLVFYGTDGQTYSYLFKGLEDLHLDERIMQFLSIANTMMAQNADPAGDNLYRARHYSVIPLGPRSGLISWVDGTTPVFALYKRWQQRELAKPNAKGSATVPRPSELFYNKLVEHGVTNIDNRKEWPLAVLKEVLTELMAETPSDLIARELWCNAVSANAWWQVVKRYSYSVAVMSIIGYIIGLGDRHLDNVLIDLLTGDVVHIDYNVCFEKGKTLRVPEKVPFRLTPNMRDALGVTGVEGIFRLACENVLKTMRKGRETLLTLLEAFVYDPLIDWTVGGEVLAGTTFAKVAGKRQSKKELEREVTLAMFDVRCTEMSVEWQENKEDIVNEIPPLVDQLNGCLALTREMEETEDELQDFHQQLALVKEAEAQGPKTHALYQLPSLYEAYIGSQGATNAAHKALTDIIRDCESHAKAFKQLLASYEAQQFSHWLDELKFNESGEGAHIFDLVKEFLHNAGKDDVVAQCEQSEIEVAQLSQHLNLQTRKCIQTFQDYFSLLVQCPRSYVDHHRTALYARWAAHLLETDSLEGCDAVFDEFRAFLDGHLQNCAPIVSVACALDAFYKDALRQLNKRYEELGEVVAATPDVDARFDQSKRSVEQLAGRGAQARDALRFYAAGELLRLNRNLLSAETTAQKSGACLFSLTSLEGVWFLDDLLLQSGRIVEVVDNVPFDDDGDPRLAQLTAGIRTGNAVHKGLDELDFNFHTIILPETMKKIQSDEPSVSTMIADLNRVIAEVGVPIQELISELEKLLTCVLMHVDVHTTYDRLLDEVARTKARYLELIPAAASQSARPLSQGEMLLTGFNGLFEKVDQALGALVGPHDVPRPWRQLDHVADAKNVAPHIRNSRVKRLLDAVFFLKRLVAVVDSFNAAAAMCASVKGCASADVYPDETLNKPVRRFIAEFISRQFLGLLPEAVAYWICVVLVDLGVDVTHEVEQKDVGAESKVPLDELYEKSYNILVKRGSFAAGDFAQAAGLLGSLEADWDKCQQPKRLEQKIARLRSSLFRLQSQSAVQNLMFDDVLSMHNFPSTRAKFLLDRQSELGQIQACYRRLHEARANQQTLVDKACQRLNWAKGANPNVLEILAAFQSSVAAHQTQLNLEQKIGNSVMQSYETLLRHETLRSTNAEPTKQFDARFLTAHDTWRQCCQLRPEALPPAQESILNMLSLDLIRSPAWLHLVALDLANLINVYRKKLQTKKETVFLQTDALAFSMNNLKAAYGAHARLFDDVKPVLKTMARIDDCGAATRRFLAAYGEFAKRCDALFGAFEGRAPDAGAVGEMLGHLDYVRAHADEIYRGLMSLRENGDGDGGGTRTRRRSCLLTVDRSKAESREQQRNAYALNVWRKVKMKLEGRDPDPGRKCTAQEQVDHVIREATSLDNLALLYEGWTPWV